MARLPYKQTLSNEAAETAATGATGQPDHNGLGFSASGHPAAGVTQRSECGPYKAEVAGSNPAARTSPHESSPSSPAHKEQLAEYIRNRERLIELEAQECSCDHREFHVCRCCREQNVLDNRQAQLSRAYGDDWIAAYARISLEAQ